MLPADYIHKQSLFCKLCGHRNGRGKFCCIGSDHAFQRHAGLAAGALLGGDSATRRNPRTVWFFIVLSGAAAMIAVPQVLQLIAGIEGSLLVRRILTGLLLCAGHVPFGAVVPVMTIGHVLTKDQAARVGGWFYAANAVGSV